MVVSRDNHFLFRGDVFPRHVADRPARTCVRRHAPEVLYRPLRGYAVHIAGDRGASDCHACLLLDEPVGAVLRDGGMDCPEKVLEDVVARLASEEVYVDIYAGEHIRGSGCAARKVRDLPEPEVEAGEPEQISQERRQGLPSLCLEVVQLQLAESVRGCHPHVIGRCDVRSVVQFRGDISLPNKRRSAVDLDLEGERVTRGELFVLPVHVALRRKVQGRAADIVVLVLAKHRGTADRTDVHRAAITVFENVDGPVNTFDTLKGETIFDSVCH